MAEYTDFLKRESKERLLRRLVYISERKDELGVRILNSKAQYPGRYSGSQLEEMRKVRSMRLSIIQLLKEQGTTVEDVDVEEKYLKVLEDERNENDDDLGPGSDQLH